MRHISILRTVRTLGSALLAALLALGLIAGPACPYGKAGGDEQRLPIIVSMGDSYSSGEGVDPFYGDKNPSNQDWMAHRSKFSWAGQLRVPGLANQLSYYHKSSWYFVATSGAVINNLYYEQSKTYDRDGTVRSLNIDAQIDILKKLREEGKQVDIVTLTLGGNDADFVKVITDAVLEPSHLLQNTDLPLRKKLNDIWDHFTELGGIRDNLLSAYVEIARETGWRSETKSGGAHIIVAGYPKLLHSAYFAQGNLFFSKSEADLINNKIHDFNEAIRSLVEACRRDFGIDIEFVSVEEAFEGHGAYADDAWIWPVMLTTQEEDLMDVPLKQLSSSYSIHPNPKGVAAYRDCVQKAIDRFYMLKGKGPEDFLRAYLYTILAHDERVLSTEPIPAIRHDTYDYTPGWSADDLNGLLMASIEDYDGDGAAELLTLSPHTENAGGSAPLTGAVLRMYEFDPSDLSVHLSAEKPVPASESFLKTQLRAEQLNCLSITKDGQRLIVLDDCRLSNDIEVTLAAYRYDGTSRFEYYGGAGYYEEGAGGVLVCEAAFEPGTPLSCAGAGGGWSQVTGWRGYDATGNEMECYERFQDILYDRFGLNGDDQRLRVNQFYDGYGDDAARIYNDLMRLTAREVYVDDTDNVRHLCCVYNCHYDDHHPVDGASWWLYRADDTGLLDACRDATGGRPEPMPEASDVYAGGDETYADEDYDDYGEDYAEDWEGYDDGESALTDLLIEAYSGDGDLLTFGYADYDGDSRMEAFALMGIYDDETFENTAELWYVCAEFAMQCERAGGCYPFDSYVTELDGRTCFRVSEGYFGSGGAERYWSAADEMPYMFAGEYMLEDLNIAY